MDPRNWSRVAQVSTPIGFGIAAASYAFLPVTLPSAVLYGVQAYMSAKTIQEDPSLGLAGLAASLALDWAFAGSSQATSKLKYVAKIGNRLERVKEVVPGAQMLVDVGGSLIPLKRIMGG